MFGDLISGTSVSLLALAFAFACAGVMRLVTWDAKRARWQREFGGGWRALQRDRIARAVQPPLPALSGVFPATPRVRRTGVAERPAQPRRPAPLRPGELVAGGSRHGGASTPGAPRAIGDDPILRAGRGSTPRRRLTLRPGNGRTLTGGR